MFLFDDVCPFGWSCWCSHNIYDRVSSWCLQKSVLCWLSSARFSTFYLSECHWWSAALIPNIHSSDRADSSLLQIASSQKRCISGKFVLSPPDVDLLGLWKVIHWYWPCNMDADGWRYVVNISKKLLLGYDRATDLQTDRLAESWPTAYQRKQQ